LLLESHAASTREVLARRIIEMGKHGERDLQPLVEDAIAHLSRALLQALDQPRRRQADVGAVSQDFCHGTRQSGMVRRVSGRCARESELVVAKSKQFELSL
jgi:hypothetical protein